MTMVARTIFAVALSLAIATTSLTCSVAAAAVRKAAPGILTNDDRSSSSSVDVVSADALSFQAWMKEHEKQYESAEEEAIRMTIWLQNRLRIDETMKRVRENTATPTNLVLGLNDMSDLSPDEFDMAMKGLLRSSSVDASEAAEKLSMDVLKDLPEELDWREQGVVSPVKNQGMCGSCWAFSTTGSIESANALATGTMVELSEQELVSCARNGNYGCRGGLMVEAMKWIIWNGGITTESDYKYRGLTNLWPFCKKRKEEDDKAVGLSTFASVPQKDSVALQQAVVGQPISIGIDAASGAFQSYRSGVIPGTVAHR